MRWFVGLLSAWLIVSGQLAVRAGDKAGDYLKDGKLKERIEVLDVLIGGINGTSGNYYAVEPDGAWSTGSVNGVKAVKGEKAKGQLTREQLGQLAKEFARHDLSHLPSHGVAASGTRVIEIHFGKKTSVLNAKAGNATAAEDKAIRARYQEIAQSVKAVCKEPKQ